MSIAFGIIGCILLLIYWARVRIVETQTKQAHCHHEWKEREVPDYAAGPPFAPIRADHPKMKVRDCPKCKLQEMWDKERNVWR